MEQRNPLDDLIRQYLENERARREALVEVNSRIARIMEEQIDPLEEQKINIEVPFKLKSDDLLAEMRPMLETIGKSYQSPDATLSFVRGRRSYNADQLDELQISRPEIWKVIKNYRSEGEPTLRIYLKREK